MSACSPRPTTVSTPRRVMDRHEVRPLVATWRADFAAVSSVDCNRMEDSKSAATLWLSGLRNAKATSKDEPVRRQSTAVECTLRLPVEVLTRVFEFCNRRMLAYDLQLVCRCFYAVSRQREFWNSFVLRDLVQESLPVVSRFVVLSNLYADEKEHKAHFWLRMLSEGRWPHPPSTVDFSCSTLRPRMVDRACRHASINTLSFAMCDGGSGEDLVAAAAPSLLAAGAKLFQLDVTLCRSFEERSLVTLAVQQQHQLSRVDVSLCEQLSPTGIGELLLALHKTLTHFSCRQTCISSASVAHLPDAALCRLGELNVAGCSDFGDEAVAELARVVCGPNGSSLSFVNLAACRSISDRGLAALASRAGCGALRHVIVDDCTRISDSGVRELLRSAPQLLEISLDRTKCRGVFFLSLNDSAASESARCRFSLCGCLYFVKELMSNPPLRNAVSSSLVSLTVSTGKFLASHRVVLCAQTAAALSITTA